MSWPVPSLPIAMEGTVRPGRMGVPNERDKIRSVPIPIAIGIIETLVPHGMRVFCLQDILVKA
jgi:hypothetical protein